VFVPLVEFEINNSVSPLGSGYTLLYADSGQQTQHPRRPLTPPDAPDPVAPAGSGEAAAHMMARVAAEVLHWQERQDQRKAALDAHQRDVQFAAGDEVPLDTEHPPVLSRSLLFPRWMGPFTVLACTAPNTYGLDIPAAWRVFPEFNVERLRPYLRRPDSLDGDAGSPPPVIGVDGGQEHEVQELLRLRMRYCRPDVLVRWAGSDASGDTWEQLDNLTSCAEAIAAFEQATGRSLPRLPVAATGRRRRRAAAADPSGRFHRGRRAARRPGISLVGRTLLYWWPDDGWQRGTVARS
jgi:hypothetical protein